MDIKEFINDFAAQFDETEPEAFKPETNYREDLEEWSSLIGFAVLDIIKRKYGVRLTDAEVKSTDTIQSLYELVVSKQQ